jgi:hypothetical protein
VGGRRSKAVEKNTLKGRIAWKIEGRMREKQRERGGLDDSRGYVFRHLR